MTVHELHDALNLLPSDLITAADRWRTAPNPKRIPWKRILPMAACLVLLLGAGLMLRREMHLSHIVMKEAVAEAPMAPAPVEQEIAADEAKAEAPAAEAPAADGSINSAVTGSENGMGEALCIDHSHRFAEESDRTVNSPNYCGNMEVIVNLDGTVYTLSGSDAVTITDILAWLDYDSDTVCRCMAEFTVDTELLTGIQVNLTQSFARCEKGQAALTESQTEAIREIIDSLA